MSWVQFSPLPNEKRGGFAEGNVRSHASGQWMSHSTRSVDSSTSGRAQSFRSTFFSRRKGQVSPVTRQATLPNKSREANRLTEKSQVMHLPQLGREL